MVPPQMPIERSTYTDTHWVFYQAAVIIRTVFFFFFFFFRVVRFCGGFFMLMDQNSSATQRLELMGKEVGTSLPQMPTERSTYTDTHWVFYLAAVIIRTVFFFF